MGMGFILRVGFPLSPDTGAALALTSLEHPVTHRSPLTVFILSVVTLGIYAIVWLVKTRGELNTQGAEIPTTWLVLIPFVGFWWLWKFSEGAARVSGGSAGAYFAVLFILSPAIGGPFIQSDLNKVQAATPAQAY